MFSYFFCLNIYDIDSKFQCNSERNAASVNNTLLCNYECFALKYEDLPKRVKKKNPRDKKVLFFFLLSKNFLGTLL